MDGYQVKSRSKPIAELTFCPTLAHSLGKHTRVHAHKSSIRRYRHHSTPYRFNYCITMNHYLNASPNDVTSIEQSKDTSKAVQHPVSTNQNTEEFDDIDARCAQDPLCATAYVQDMYQHFRSKEASTSARPVYMEHQPHINERMRATLVDWLMGIHMRLRFAPETLYLTVNLIDRFLDQKEVNRPQLQGVGVAALWIAMKYEEIDQYPLCEFLYWCAEAYTDQDIIDAEKAMLETLGYQVTVPTAFTFLLRFLEAGNANQEVADICYFLLDGALLSYELNRYLPSQLAAAAVLIARGTAGYSAWSPTLSHYTNYSEEEIVPVARAILAQKSSSPTDLVVVTLKYMRPCYGSVANKVLYNDF
jgi:hypothetical protein